MKTKICTKCKVEKPIEAFYRRKSFKDGREYECKPCLLQRKQAWRNKQLLLFEIKEEPKAKTCNECKIEKPIEEFYKNKYKKDGRKTRCAACCNKYNENWGKPKPAYIRPKTKVCSKCKIEKPLEDFYPRKDRATSIGVTPQCRECWSKHRKWLWRNDQEYRERNDKRGKIYNATHKKEKSEYNKDYGEKNKVRRAKRVAARMKTDLNFKLRARLSVRVRSALKQQGTNKSKKTMELLGCTMDFFREYIASQFTNGMTWENYGRKGWNMDHIKPCASFDLTDIEQQKECFHYSNLQPLWETENIHKSSFYNGKFWRKNA